MTIAKAEVIPNICESDSEVIECTSPIPKCESGQRGSCWEYSVCGINDPQNGVSHRWWCEAYGGIWNSNNSTCDLETGWNWTDNTTGWASSWSSMYPVSTMWTK